MNSNNTNIMLLALEIAKFILTYRTDTFLVTN